MFGVRYMFAAAVAAAAAAAAAAVALGFRLLFGVAGGELLVLVLVVVVVVVAGVVIKGLLMLLLLPLGCVEVGASADGKPKGAFEFGVPDTIELVMLFVPLQSKLFGLAPISCCCWLANLLANKLVSSRALIEFVVVVVVVCGGCAAAAANVCVPS